MNFELLFRAASASRSPASPVIRYALTGAGGGFARTLLAQTRLIDRLAPTVLCDLDLGGLRALCLELGYDAASLVECSDAASVRSLAPGQIALVRDVALLDPAAFDILVEGTGNPSVGYRAARAALEAKRHVAMVSKEVDAVAGVSLAQFAAQQGVVYTTADGDQPSNLIGWVSWARTLGLDIVAAGKSSEYDLVFDDATGEVTQLDQRFAAPELANMMTLGDDVAATLAARRAALRGRKTSATADYCEMTVVATNTGLVPDVELLHYPVARTTELADIYALREDGGVLSRTGVIDVFNMLRRPDEASFAGGVFVVVRTTDAPTWALLAQKGHVVSRNGRYACLYLPYHFMGVETPITLLEAVLHGRPTGAAQPTQCAVLAGRATDDIKAGTVLHMGGHHHDVTGVQAVLLPREAAGANVAPLYLAAHATLARDVAAGELLTLDHLQNADEALLAAWQAGAK
ncbi:homoserine dehydrogenase [Paraburkholderia tropica]|uniref:Predicted homoserine dehydrogenase, contains C-terminal SAF domain n=1 Tax=Paraburkholderia tropica TaxID=92647 RepID=A0AAQ1JU78_9BURK|nr:homoserine dehydrogenase [Paraburkholderia tropica]RQN39398.1 homoserine dehydrogenase [Paraburkholderia tropica]SEJ68245.1 Predicted homoserine dehydrogenase, contains C-terminal SAF domain [Paraburkholderia tropica]